jgi:CheY-like chemotaxis protein
MSTNEWQDTEVDMGRPTPPTRQLVVLAEDDDDTRRVYSLILRHFGYRVEEAVTGHEAVALTRSLRPSLVLMDIGLPGLDGFQASRLLKSDPATSGIPLIAFSARVDSTADLVGGAPTFDGFILKPVSPRELVKRVDAYLALLGGTPRQNRGDLLGYDYDERDPRERSVRL